MKQFNEEETQEPADHELLTIREVSKALRVDDTTTRRWVTQGILDAVILPYGGKRKSYRIKRSVLNELIEGKTS